ncbi:MAG TPA: hypothetical protein VKA67_04545, partial [Verrucomicrobiae bacterium]|nr:hypothetical protein [Verrucomicrobiae bacterium]
KWFLKPMKRPSSATPYHRMNPELKLIPQLADIEREVMAQAREWGRQRLQERLQALAHQHGEIFPPEAVQAATARVAQRIGKDRTVS